MRILLKSLVPLSLFVVLAGISGCDETVEIKNWVENMNKLRVKATELAKATPYRNEQYKGLKEYFAEINQMALALKNDSNLENRFNAAISQMDLEAACSKVFMAKVEWRRIMGNCTRNRFFLCADEVRAYPDLVAALRGHLNRDQQARFDRTASCSVR